VVPQHVTVAAPAPFRDGELQHHLASIVEANSTSHLRYAGPRVETNSPRGFDRAVARNLVSGDVFIGFGGATLESFRRARKLGYRQLALEPATTHVRNEALQQERALAAHPIESGRLTTAEMRRREAEYALADCIYVASSYAMRTFLERGIDEKKLQRRVPTVAASVQRPASRRSNGRFTILYSGRLDVINGVALLIDAFRRFSDRDAELRLSGSFATRSMEQYVRRAVAADARIRIHDGDPLTAYHDADVFAYPSYDDALGLGAMTALACGVPVVVSDHTGACELVRDGINGYVVRAGDRDALLERLECLRP
jgi:glycosyltransferase involved in cell wall biosynthesis